MIRKNIFFTDSEEKTGLAQFLKEHLDFISDEEQAEIDTLDINFDDLSGKELSVCDLL